MEKCEGRTAADVARLTDAQLGELVISYSQGKQTKADWAAWLNKEQNSGKVSVIRDLSLAERMLFPKLKNLSYWHKTAPFLRGSNVKGSDHSNTNEGKDKTLELMWGKMFTCPTEALIDVNQVAECVPTLLQSTSNLHPSEISCVQAYCMALDLGLLPRSSSTTSYGYPNDPEVATYQGYTPDFGSASGMSSSAPPQDWQPDENLIMELF
nr:uncharacterized protein CI109_006582 [Kwoniella shandongensis]KAA5525120.1 hypothetical protein CI109_006582 [Kwoniella shandongensis]